MRSPHAPRARAVALLVAVLLVPSLAAAYTQPDLSGPWRSQSIGSGPGAPWWERSRAIITTSGGLTVYAVDNLGELDTLQASISLDPAGIVTFPGAPAFHGALDLGTTFFVGTDTWTGWGAGTTELKTAVKSLGGYTVANLAGDWEVNSIASGAGAPWWMRGRMSIASNGALSGTFTDNTGASDPVGGSLGVAADGAVSLSFAPLAQGWVDAGRTVMALTNTWSDGTPGTAEMAVLLRMASSYAPSDLAGTWELHILATGPGAPWWSHGQIVIASNGTASGTMFESDGSSHPVSGTFTLASNGVLARSGAPTARGVLDAGRTVMVWTDTWTTGAPGTSEMTIGVRIAGGSTAGAPAPAASAFALERVRPNPARGRSLDVAFTLADAGAARLELLDVAGRVLAARDVGALGSGAHRVSLSPAAPVRPGLYFVRLRQGANTRTERVTVLD